MALIQDKCVSMCKVLAITVGPAVIGSLLPFVWSGQVCDLPLKIYICASACAHIFLACLALSTIATQQQQSVDQETPRLCDCGQQYAKPNYFLPWVTIFFLLLGWMIYGIYLLAMSRSCLVFVDDIDPSLHYSTNRLLFQLFLASLFLLVGVQMTVAAMLVFATGQAKRSNGNVPVIQDVSEQSFVRVSVNEIG